MKEARQPVRPFTAGLRAWHIDAGAGGLAFLVYLATLAPTITWRNQGADGGDLAAAAFTLGIPHPPGYPLYTLVAAVFARLPLGEPAWNIGLFSALAAAGAVILVRRAASNLLAAHFSPRSGLLAAGAVAVAYAFTPLFWSQATIVEVYALNALFTAGLLAVLLSSHPYRLPLAAGILGLGSTHHLSILLFLPTAVLLLAGGRWSRARWLQAAFLFVAPLLFYLYLPVRAAADPPVNWGDPRTPERIWWMLSAAAYRPYLFSLSPEDVLARGASSARLLFDQFNVWGVALGLWGIAQMALSEDHTVRRQLVAMAVGFALITAYAILYGTHDSYVYLLPAFVLFTLAIAFGLGDLVSRVRGRWAQGALVAALIFFPAFNLIVHLPEMDLSRDHAAFDYAAGVFHSVPDHAVIFADADEHLFALWYYRYVIVPASSEVSVYSPELLQYDWYYEQVLPAGKAGSFRRRVAEAVYQSLSEHRPVYTTMSSDWFADFTLVPQGSVFQIVERAR